MRGELVVIINSSVLQLHTDEESSVVLLSSAQAETKEERELAAQPETLTVPPVEMPLTPTNITENLFSEHEMIEGPPNEQETQQHASETETSLIGTSAPLLSNPSLTDVLSNFPIWPQLDQPKTQDPQATIPKSSQILATSSIGALGHVSSATTQEESKLKGQSPAGTTTDKNKPKQLRCRGMRKRGRPRGPPPKKTSIPTQQTASSTSDFEISDPSAHVTTDQESSDSPINLRYGLRRDRAPRYRCGTCGLRDCNCNLIINKENTKTLSELIGNTR